MKKEILMSLASELKTKPGIELAGVMSVDGMLNDVAFFFEDYPECISESSEWFGAENFFLEINSAGKAIADLSKGDLVFYYQKGTFTTYAKINSESFEFGAAFNRREARILESAVNEFFGGKEID